MKGGDNDVILNESGSIAEVMRRMKAKIAELDAQAEGAVDPDVLQEQEGRQATESTNIATVVTPRSASSNEDGDSFECHENNHTPWDEQGGYYGARKRPHFTPSMSPQRRSKEEAEIAEELRLLEEATVNLAATSQMKARYAYTDSVDAESELHLILESVRDFYRYVTLSRPLIWHIPHCILIAYWHLADPPPLSLSLFAAVM